MIIHKPKGKPVLITLETSQEALEMLTITEMVIKMCKEKEPSVELPFLNKLKEGLEGSNK